MRQSGVVSRHNGRFENRKSLICGNLKASKCLLAPSVRQIIARKCVHLGTRRFKRVCGPILRENSNSADPTLETRGPKGAQETVPTWNGSILVGRTLLQWARVDAFAENDTNKDVIWGKGGILFDQQDD